MHYIISLIGRERKKLARRNNFPTSEVFEVRTKVISGRVVFQSSVPGLLEAARLLQGSGGGPTRFEHARLSRRGWTWVTQRISIKRSCEEVAWNTEFIKLSAADKIFTCGGVWAGRLDKYNK